MRRPPGLQRLRHVFRKEERRPHVLPLPRLRPRRTRGLRAQDFRSGAAIGNGKAYRFRMRFSDAQNSSIGSIPVTLAPSRVKGSDRNPPPQPISMAFNSFEGAESPPLIRTPPLDFLHDKLKAGGIDGMEGAELAPFVPPFGRKPFEAPQLFCVQGWTSPCFCLNLHRWPFCFSSDAKAVSSGFLTALLPA